MRRNRFSNHRKLWYWFGFLAFQFGMLILPPEGNCQEAAGETGSEVSFEAFEIILNRNIFDPNRTADRRKLSPAEEAAAVKPDLVESATEENGVDDFKSEEVALVGTLIDGSTAVAFFTSDSSDFKTVAQRGEMVGEFRLAEIGTGSVKLESEGKKIELPVGSRMSSQRNGDWIIALNIQATPMPKNENASESSRKDNSSTPSGEASSSSSTTSPSSSGDSTDDVLKQLMERRRKALEK